MERTKELELFLIFLWHAYSDKAKIHDAKYKKEVREYMLTVKSINKFNYFHFLFKPEYVKTFIFFQQVKEEILDSFWRDNVTISMFYFSYKMGYISKYEWEMVVQNYFELIHQKDPHHRHLIKNEILTLADEHRFTLSYSN